jgi:hypothetical protein
MLDAFSGTQGGAAAIIANEAEPAFTNGAARCAEVPVVLVVVVGHVRLLWLLRRSCSRSHAGQRYSAASASY